MDDLISRQAAKLKVARVIWEEGDSCYDFHDKCVDCLDDVPPAQPERKTGEWIRISIDKYTQHAQAWYRCSQCQGEFIGKWNYCPNCGARMEGEE